MSLWRNYRFGNRKPEKMASEVVLRMILGKTENQAKKILKQINQREGTGYSLRVIEEDGSPYMIVNDYYPQRINICLKEGKISDEIYFDPTPEEQFRKQQVAGMQRLVKESKCEWKKDRPLSSNGQMFLKYDRETEELYYSETEYSSDSEL